MGQRYKQAYGWYNLCLENQVREATEHLGGRCTLVLLNMDLEGDWLSGILIECFTVCNFYCFGNGVGRWLSKGKNRPKDRRCHFFKRRGSYHCYDSVYDIILIS